jgi:CubicO group peptidase (beta-lactamase class C family)
VVLVGRRDEILWHAAFGSRVLEPERAPMGPDIVFDLSSLTKPLATVSALLVLMREGKLRIDDKITRFVPNFGVYGKHTITVAQLLAHCAGLAAWRPYHRELARTEKQRLATRAAAEMVFERVHRERLEYEPGTKSVYSDLGFMLLGELVEILGHMPLDRFCAERIFRPLRLRATGFVDLAGLRMRKIVPVSDAIAPTERCPWRGRVLCGEVHDDNAWAMGGVAGHAGLFSTARDVHRLVAVLAACARGEEDFFPPELVRRMWRRDDAVPGSSWALGWDTPTPGTSSAGTKASPRAVGHLGFTGTSVWIDPDRDAHVVLLTNRVHPTRTNEKIRAVRPRVHDAVWEALDA